jgi:ACR3 family arsenite transporter
VLLPVFLVLFLGTEMADIVEFGPFLDAFLTLIAAPLALAWLTQACGPAGAAFSRAVSTAMVPLMVVTLLVVVASQVPKVGVAVLGVVPFYVVFLVVMAGLGVLVARGFRLAVPEARAIVFTGATRNSLVVLPLALALPGSLRVAGIVVVTQTLVEVAGMVIYVRVVPRLVPVRAGNK